MEKRVLVVDDNTTFLSLVAIFLEASGFAVREFSNPRLALDFLSKETGNFDLLVTDFEMPEMNGAELIAAIKGKQPSIRVICLTGTPGAENDCLEAGCDCFLEKPVRFRHLHEEIKKVLSN